MGWLVLSRELEQEIQIGDSIRIKVMELRESKVRIGILAPPDVAIVRDDAKRTVRVTRGEQCES